MLTHSTVSIVTLGQSAGQGAGYAAQGQAAGARQQDAHAHDARSNTTSCVDDTEEYLDEETMLMLAASVAEEEEDDKAACLSATKSKGASGNPNSAKRRCTETV